MKYKLTFERETTYYEECVIEIEAASLSDAISIIESDDYYQRNVEVISQDLNNWHTFIETIDLPLT